MVRTVTIEELQQRTTELLDDANRCGEPILVKDGAETRGVVISVAEYERYEQRKRDAWDRGWDAVDRIRERNADRDPDEIYRFVTEIVEEVRQEMYDAGRHMDSNER
jgi:prevent-host-death family protein